MTGCKHCTWLIAVGASINLFISAQHDIDLPVKKVGKQLEEELSRLTEAPKHIFFFQFYITLFSTASGALGVVPFSDICSSSSSSSIPRR